MSERRMKRYLFIVMLLLASCSQEPSQAISSGLALNIGEVLGGNNTEGFLRAEQTRDFIFPEDHGRHEGFRNEWWYFTGNLQTDDGRRFPYQVTFFNVALKPTATIDSSSQWQSDRIWMAHAALSDVENQQHIALERFSRENPGLAGAQIGPYKVWLENWSLEASSNNAFPWRLKVNDPTFSLDLLLSPEKDLVLQGEKGLSQKSPELGNASYYYSYTRLNTSGSLTYNNEVFQLAGESWLDREWSSSALADDQTGWDWFSLQFNDGQELMYYQLRDSEGLAHGSSQGNWTNQESVQTLISLEDIHLEELEAWVGPNGISYTTRWAMSYQDQQWIIQSVLDDQLMELSIEYWEGAVDILRAQNLEKVGQGFLEMLRE